MLKITCEIIINESVLYSPFLSFNSINKTVVKTTEAIVQNLNL